VLYQKECYYRGDTHHTKSLIAKLKHSIGPKMLRINIFNIKEFGDDGEEKAEGEENENKIVQLFHCFIVGNLISYY
jgi:hypothetical protein